jgi:hypothetical protein
MISTTNAETIGTLQKPHKQSLVELNQKRLEKLAMRRKIIENEIRSNTMPTETEEVIRDVSISPSKNTIGVDMPTQVAEINFTQDSANNQS